MLYSEHLDVVNSSLDTFCPIFLLTWCPESLAYNFSEGRPAAGPTTPSTCLSDLATQEMLIFRLIQFFNNFTLFSLQQVEEMTQNLEVRGML